MHGAQGGELQSPPRHSTLVLLIDDCTHSITYTADITSVPVARSLMCSKQLESLANMQTLQGPPNSQSINSPNYHNFNGSGVNGSHVVIHVYIKCTLGSVSKRHHIFISTSSTSIPHSIITATAIEYPLPVTKSDNIKYEVLWFFFVDAGYCLHWKSLRLQL